MYFNDIDNHIKNKFKKNEKFIELKKLPESEKEIETLEADRVYKLPLISLAVDIVDSKSCEERYGIENWSKILSEFIYGVSKIMKEYSGKWITIQGDGIYCLFNGDKKEEIDNSFSCSCVINTFKSHLNSLIGKILNGNERYRELDFGIGLWLSFENYISKVGISKNTDIVFMGDSVNFSNTLAKLASRKGCDSILFNELFMNNFSDEVKNKNYDTGSFNIYNNILNNIKIYGCNWTLTNYSNFIKTLDENN